MTADEGIPAMGSPSSFLGTLAPSAWWPMQAHVETHDRLAALVVPLLPMS